MERAETGPCCGCEELTCPIRQVVGAAGLSGSPNAVSRVSARAGEKLDVADFAPDTVFRVVNGMLMQEHVSNDGRRHIAAFKTNGDLSWPLPQQEPGDIREYYEAVQPTELCIISVDPITESTPDAAGLVKALYGAARDEVSRTQSRMFLLARSSAAERLAGFLLDLADRTGRATKRGVELKLSMRRERIADHLGMQPETISRIMSSFKKAAIIRLPRPSLVIIPDLKALSNVAVGAI
ncbi:Crp/Fnr family transcriptional regulator [Nisaea sp.]